MDNEVKMHLKEWLIAQVDSEQYEGLSWENEDKTMFRIPWKHAAKKDYNQDEDAALFKAWAVYKGKFREGRDKPDPTMWKTRLRCALNKSTDFQEVTDRSQLDISEPYKVYRIAADTVRKAESPHMERMVAKQSGRSDSPTMCPRSTHPQVPAFTILPRESFEEIKEESNACDVLMQEHMYCGLGKGKSHSSISTIQSLFRSTLIISDFRMQVRLFYQGKMVMDVITSSPDGCFILHGCVPLGNEQIYGPCTAQQLYFPQPEQVPMLPDMASAMAVLLSHLEKGVLLWVAPDGVFIKRFCQGRVYWRGPLAQHADRPNKLDREKTCKLIDVPVFFKELQNHLEEGGPTPGHEIELCFGEEFPDPNVLQTNKLILVQVIPMFAVDLLQRFLMREMDTDTTDRAVL